MYHQPNTPRTHTSTMSLLLLLPLLLPTPHTTQISPSALPRISNSTSSTLHTIHSALSIPTQRTLTLNRLSVLILSAALSAVDALLAQRVADRLQQAALADLPGDEAVDAVLELVDLRDAGYFGFIEVLCGLLAFALSLQRRWIGRGRVW